MPFEGAVYVPVPIPPDTSTLIDDVLDPKYVEKIYEWGLGLGNWRERFGCEPLDFGGGEFGLTIALMLEFIPEKELGKIRGIGKKRSAQIYEQLREAMAAEPGY